MNNSKPFRRSLPGSQGPVLFILPFILAAGQSGAVKLSVKGQAYTWSFAVDTNPMGRSLPGSPLYSVEWKR